MAWRISNAMFMLLAMISAVSIAFRSPLAMIWVVSESRLASARAIARALPMALKPHEGTGTDGSIATCGWVR